MPTLTPEELAELRAMHVGWPGHGPMDETPCAECGDPRWLHNRFGCGSPKCGCVVFRSPSLKDTLP